MNMRKVIIADIIVLALIFVGVVAFYFAVVKPGVDANKPRAQINSEKPQYENHILKTREDFCSEKEFAVYLYETANKAFQECESCASIDDYLTTTSVVGLFSMSSQGCRFTVKNGTEYYYADYSGVAKRAEKFMDILGKAEDTMFAIRSYTDISKMDYLYTEKVLYPNVSIDDDGGIEVSADWSDGNRVSGYPKHDEMPIFHKSQEGMYEQTEMKINLATVSGATVTYDKEQEYYVVSFVLDVNNHETYAKTIGNLRAGLPDANYTSITKVYEIWDNGYFRHVESLDHAANSAMSIKLDFKTYFKYREEECDPSHYRYFDGAKQNALAEIK